MDTRKTSHGAGSLHTRTQCTQHTLSKTRHGASCQLSTTSCIRATIAGVQTGHAATTWHSSREPATSSTTAWQLTQHTQSKHTHARAQTVTTLVLVPVLVLVLVLFYSALQLFWASMVCSYCFDGSHVDDISNLPTLDVPVSHCSVQL